MCLKLGLKAAQNCEVASEWLEILRQNECLPGNARANNAPHVNVMPHDQSPSGRLRSGPLETKVIGGLAILILAALSAWSWATFLTFKPDSRKDYGILVGELEGAQEHLQQGRDNQSGYLDIKVKGSDIVYRVPRDGYFDYFLRDRFFKEARLGDMVELWALKTDLASPTKFGDAHVVFVREVKIGEVTYCDFGAHVAWQVRNNRWTLALAIALSLVGALVFSGLLVTAKSQPPSNLASNYLPLRFTGRGSDIFSGNGLIASLAALSIVGFPVAAVYYYRWIASHTATPKGESLAFVGSISVAYGITILSLIVQLSDEYLPLGEFYSLFASPTALWIAIVLVTLAFYVVQGAVAYLQFRFCVDNLRLPDGTSIRSSVPLVRFILIQVICVLSVFTILGWAWCTVWGTRWVTRHIKSRSTAFRFVGTGFQCLWRTLAALAASTLLITVPWVIAWIVRWFVTSMEVVETQESNQLRA